MDKNDKPKAKPTPRQAELPLVVTLLLGAAVLAFGFEAGIYFWSMFSAEKLLTGWQKPHRTAVVTPAAGQPAAQAESVRPFRDAADFRAWLADMPDQNAGFGYGGMLAPQRMMVTDMAPGLAAPSMGLGMKAAETATSGGGADVSQRYSETNVQVAGIDEPDIVKTDGKEIYYASPNYGWWGGVMPMPAIRGTSIGKPLAPIRAQSPGVRAIKAFPPSAPKSDTTIDDRGDLLLSGQTLLVLAVDGVHAYDVSDPAKPAEKWRYDYEDGIGLTAARLKDGKVYLVLRRGVVLATPCPVPLLKRNGDSIVVPCGNVYHPIKPVASDVTYSIVTLDAQRGTQGDTVSFVGSTSDTTVYMSADNIYVANAYPGDFVAFLAGFMNANADLTTEAVRSRIARLATYELSDAAKMAELQDILQRWYEGLSDDDRLKAENEYANRMAAYHKEHGRDLQRTGIVRVTAADLKVAATGDVPGTLLNQFSLDEDKGHLRVATTTGGRRAWWSWQLGLDNSDSVNDVYVLDSGLKTVGSALGLGQSERIYSVRFIGDRGYVVTFRETDPFYVLDLADPTKPTVKGELKIPGYSSYLHPLMNDVVLGIGKEGNQVKLSMFDVKDPANPQEVAKYLLDEYWTDVQNNHHAFLQDAQHAVFFLPGGKGGYVFGYADRSLTLKKAVSNVQAKRAVYIGDYLYVIGDGKLTVLDEKDWSTAGELTWINESGPVIYE